MFSSFTARTARRQHHAADWRQLLAQSIRDPDELIDLLELPADLKPAAQAAAREFPLLAPRGYVARMRKGDPRDPLLLQVLPLALELREAAGFLRDPVGDLAARQAPGLLQKYAGRALLITTGACAVHCRYCFRRHYPYSEEPSSPEAWRPALSAIAEDETIHEVILSGGDPLVLSDRRLQELFAAIRRMPHVKRLRLHSRLPIVLPERVTARLIALLKGAGIQPVVVVHANHASELVGECAAALARLVESGVCTLNQAVLLAGVNDSADAQVALHETLVGLGVLPYYLHQLDKVAGAAHFEVNPRHGVALMQAVRLRLPGYAVPRYVREEPGAGSKRPIG
jgi:EF-P beta-lysylation protein EpmB